MSDKKLNPFYPAAPTWLYPIIRNARENGDTDVLPLALTAYASILFDSAKSNIRFAPRLSQAEIAAKPPEQRMALAAAMDLLALVAYCPQGRKVLRDFGLEAFPQIQDAPHV